MCLRHYQSVCPNADETMNDFCQMNPFFCLASAGDRPALEGKGRLDKGLDAAPLKSWTIANMTDDWNRILPAEM